MALSLRLGYLGTPSAGNPSKAGVAVTIGDYIIVGWSGNQASNGTSAGTVADNASGGTNTYSEVTRKTINAPPAGTSCAVHVHVAVAKATETLTITATVPASEVDNCMIVHVVQGGSCTLAQVVDQSAGKADTSAGTSRTSGSITNTNANDYIFVLYANGDNAMTMSENGTSFTKQQEDTGHQMASFDRVVAATGTYNDAATITVSSSLVSIIASFKESASGAPPYVGAVSRNSGLGYSNSAGGGRQCKSMLSKFSRGMQLHQGVLRPASGLMLPEKLSRNEARM